MNQFSSSDTAYQSLSMVDILRNQAQNNPDRPALTYGSTTLTYAELDSVTNQLAKGLLNSGVNRGDIVAMVGSNSLDHALIQHALSKIGAGLAVLNWRQTADEMDYAVKLVGPKLVFAQQEFSGLIDSDAHDVFVIQDANSQDFRDRFIYPFDATTPGVAVDPEDIATIIYTSGTTGRPKAAAISQRAMIARAAFAATDMRLTADDAHLAWAPMFHLVSADYMFICAVLGSHYIVVDGYDVDLINEYVHTEQLGWLVLMPGAIEALVERVNRDGRNPKPIKTVGAMADLIPPNQIAALTTALDTPFYNSYGMTEAGPLTNGTIGIGEIPENLGKRFTVLANYQLVTADGDIAETNEAGELWVCGPTLFTCYLNDPEATAEALADGWYHSGDILRRDENGLLHFESRSKYLIKSGGENIYPAEIERVLMGCPGVREAVVVGIRDDTWGETPVAFVAMNGDFDEGALKDECRKHLAGYKIPSQIHLTDIDDFPRNVTGKVIREQLEARISPTTPQGRQP